MRKPAQPTVSQFVDRMYEVFREKPDVAWAHGVDMPYAQLSGNPVKTWLVRAPFLGLFRPDMAERKITDLRKAKSTKSAISDILLREFTAQQARPEMRGRSSDEVMSAAMTEVLAKASDRLQEERRDTTGVGETVEAWMSNPVERLAQRRIRATQRDIEKHGLQWAHPGRDLGTVPDSTSDPTTEPPAGNILRDRLDRLQGASRSVSNDDALLQLAVASPLAGGAIGAFTAPKGKRVKRGLIGAGIGTVLGALLESQRGNSMLGGIMKKSETMTVDNALNRARELHGVVHTAAPDWRQAGTDALARLQALVAENPDIAAGLGFTGAAALGGAIGGRKGKRMQTALKTGGIAAVLSALGVGGYRYAGARRKEAADARIRASDADAVADGARVSGEDHGPRPEDVAAADQKAAQTARDRAEHLELLRGIATGRQVTAQTRADTRARKQAENAGRPVLTLPAPTAAEIAASLEARKKRHNAPKVGSEITPEKLDRARGKVDNAATKRASEQHNAAMRKPEKPVITITPEMAAVLPQSVQSSPLSLDDALRALGLKSPQEYSDDETQAKAQGRDDLENTRVYTPPPVPTQYY